jgi:hypothetical protein
VPPPGWARSCQVDGSQQRTEGTLSYHASIFGTRHIAMGGWAAGEATAVQGVRTSERASDPV